MSEHSQLVELLQKQAATIVKRPKGELFAIWWARLCLKAGVPLFAKAGLQASEEKDLPPDVVRAAEDLTFEEILQVAAHIHDEHEAWIVRLGKRIDHLKGIHA